MEDLGFLVFINSFLFVNIAGFDIKTYDGAIQVSLDPTRDTEVFTRGYTISYQVLGTNHVSTSKVPPHTLEFNITTPYMGSLYVIKFFNMSDHLLITKYARSACSFHHEMSLGDTYHLQTPGYPVKLHPGIMCKWDIGSKDVVWYKIAAKNVTVQNHTCQTFIKVNSDRTPWICGVGSTTQTYVIPNSSFNATFMSKSTEMGFEISVEAIPALEGPSDVNGTVDHDGITITWTWAGRDFTSLQCAVVQRYDSEIAPVWDLVPCNMSVHHINTTRHRGQMVNIYMTALTPYWHSNASNTIQLRTDCSQHYFLDSGETVAISSRDLLGINSPDAECRWNINTIADNFLKIHIDHVTLADDIDCSKEYLMLTELGKLCGKVQQDGPHVIHSNHLEIFMKIGKTKDGKDFNFTISSVDSPTDPPTGVRLHTDGNHVNVSLDGHHGNKTILEYIIVYDVIPDRPSNVIFTNDTSVRIDTSKISGKMLAVRVASKTEGGKSNFSRDGFVRSNCGASRLLKHRETMFIIAPTVNGRYQSDVVCKWTVQTEQNLKLLVTFENVSMEESPGCNKDYIQTSSSKDRLCGRNTNTTFVSKANDIQILFVTDESNEEFGFIASVTALLPAPGQPENLKVKTSPYGILVTWEKPKIHPDNLRGYTIYYSINDTDHVTSVRLSATTSHFLIDTSCNPGVEFTIWSVANGEAESSAQTPRLTQRSSCGNIINLSADEEFIALGPQQTNISIVCEWSVESIHPYTLYILDLDPACLTRPLVNTTHIVSINSLTAGKSYSYHTGHQIYQYTCDNGSFRPLVARLSPRPASSDKRFLNPSTFVPSRAHSFQLFHKSIL